MDYSQILAKQFNIREQYATNIISLLDEGNTIPFIARYRKEMHGSMDDQLIREFSEKLEYLRNLDKRREEIRNLIAAADKAIKEERFDDLIELSYNSQTPIPISLENDGMINDVMKAVIY